MAPMTCLVVLINGTIYDSLRSSQPPRSASIHDSLPRNANSVTDARQFDAPPVMPLLQRQSLSSYSSSSAPPDSLSSSPTALLPPRDTKIMQQSPPSSPTGQNADPQQQPAAGFHPSRGTTRNPFLSIATNKTGGLQQSQSPTGQNAGPQQQPTAYFDPPGSTTWIPFPNPIMDRTGGLQQSPVIAQYPPQQGYGPSNMDASRTLYTYAQPLADVHGGDQINPGAPQPKLKLSEKISRASKGFGKFAIQAIAKAIEFGTGIPIPDSGVKMVTDLLSRLTSRGGNSSVAPRTDQRVVIWYPLHNNGPVGYVYLPSAPPQSVPGPMPVQVYQVQGAPGARRDGEAGTSSRPVM